MIQNLIEKKDIEFDKKIYNIKIYIDIDKVCIDLEQKYNSESKYFINKFNLEEIKNLDDHFNVQTIDKIIDIIDDLELLDKKITIEEIEENLNLIFHLKKTNIKFPLNKKNEEINLNYNTLSEKMKKIIDQNELILGIDLGTTYSCASIMLDNHYIVIQNSLGEKITPSYVGFLNENNICVGRLAKLLPSNEKNIIFNSKRLLGKDKIENNLPFDLNRLEVDDKFNSLKIKTYFPNKIKRFYPEQISAMILKKIIIDSEDYLSKKIGKNIKINNAVITIPAYFNQKQRDATKNAAEIIGLNIKGMINEPTAASLAYGYDSLGNTEKIIVIIDFGGGTLDITLLKFKKDEDGIHCVVKFTDGDSNFGGEDFDDILMEKCLNSKNYKEIPNKIRLKKACEEAKIKLSKFDSANIKLEQYNLDINITREEFEEYCSNLFIKFEKKLDEFILESKVEKEKINEVIIIGGSIKIPKIKSIIKNKFNFSKIKDNLNPKETVAIGASIQGINISNLNSINKINLLDVTNLPLGIEIIGSIMSNIINRSCPFPIELEETFQTVEDNQEKALIKIYEGDKEKITDNLYLGQFEICNLTKKKAGETKIRVKFRIDKFSLLNVTAYEEENTNNQNSLIIKYEANEKKINQIKELKVEKPNNISKIMDILQKEQNSLIYFDLEEYNKIKESIIEEEFYIINYKKNNEKKFFEKIRTSKIKIIKNIGNFIIEKFEKYHKEENEKFSNEDLNSINNINIDNEKRKKEKKKL